MLLYLLLCMIDKLQNNKIPTTLQTKKNDCTMRFIKTPFTMIIAGPSFCGKTTFLTRLILSLLKKGEIKMKNIIWYNGVKNAVPKFFFDKITVIDNVPASFDDVADNSILIFDDLMNDAYTKGVCELFTKGCHHRNLTVILITQNLFHQGKFCRDIALNCRYLVMFKNPRDRSQILPLARQIYPENTTELMKVYNDVTSKPHGYLLFDLTQDINNILRFRTNIFKEFSTCFCSKNQIGGNDCCKKYQTFDGQPTFTILPKEK